MNFHLAPASRTGEEVARLLRRMIHSGELPEGTRIPPQRELAAELGISCATLREALAELRVLGYVTTLRGAHGGTRIAALGSNAALWTGRLRSTIGDFDELCEYRIAVEAHAARLAAVRRTEAQLSIMEESIGSLRQDMDRAAFRAQDSVFHSTIAVAAGNGRLDDAIRTVRGEFFIPTDNLNFLPSIPTTRDAHSAILGAIKRGDADRAASLMTQHIAASRDELHDILSID